MLQPRRHPRRGLTDHLLLGLLVAATAWLLLTFARGPGELAAIWVGNGIVAGWLLNRPTAAWPGYLAVAYLAELPVRVLTGDGVPYALSIASCNVLEALAVAAVIRRGVPDIRAPAHWMRFGGVATAATLMACAAVGLPAAAISWGLNDQAFLPAAARWYTAHVLGMVVVGSMTLVMQREGLGLFHAPDRGWGLAGVTALVAAIAAAVFLLPYPLLFMAYPALLLAAVRHHFAGACLGILALALVAGTATSMDLGPLAPLAVSARIMLLQAYIAGGCLLTIPVCLATAERRRLLRGLHESRRELERLSRVDALTSLPNRRQLDERLALALGRLQRHRIPFALLCLDIDRFKGINDFHGHVAGDVVLKAFGARLLECVRETDLVVRMGGDEFVILLDDAPPGAAERVATKVVNAMAAPVEAGASLIDVSTSIGVAQAIPGDDAVTLAAAADAALYAAKNSGRNRFHVAARPERSGAQCQ